MPTRILNVVRFPIGGIRSYLRYTYPKLGADAYTTTVLTIDVPEAQLLPPGMRPLAVELKTVPVRQAFPRLAMAAHGLLRTRKFDLVHSQGTSAAVASALSARIYGVPHVITLHETFRDEQFQGPAGEIRRRILSQVFSRADGLITVSNDARENLLRHVPFSAAAAGRVRVIRNGVATDTVLRESVESAPGLRERWGIEPGSAVLGFVGRFMPEKGFGVLLDAVRLLQARASSLPKFVVVAVNDGAFAREYKQQVTDWDLDRSFVFTGFQATAAGTMAELDAVIMPSLREACPLVAMEAMVLGRPLIASDCIGLRELTEGSPSITSVAGDPASLAQAIEHFLLNQQTIQASARGYTEIARGSFDSSTAAKSLIALFGQALGES